MLIYNLDKAAGKVGREGNGAGGGSRQAQLGDLEQVFIQLGVQHGHFRLGVFVRTRENTGNMV